MNAKTVSLSVIASVLVLVSAAFAQDGGNFELGAQVGGQLVGGIDLSTTLYKRIELGNSLSYGATVGYLMGEHYGVEFQWSRSRSDARAQPLLGGPSVRLLDITSNLYLGNVLLYLTPRESHMRPFALFGLGANDLHPSRPGVPGSTRFTFALGGGAKYYMGKHFGLRGQLQWVPTYLGTTNNGGYWCDPFWGGCWLVGNSHYLHSFDVGAGVTLRF